MGVTRSTTNAYKPELRRPATGFIVELCAHRLQILLVRAAAILLPVISFAAAAADTDSTLRFSGDESDRTPVFERSGPWMLDWTTKSEDTLPKIFELRLYDADSGEFVGTIVEAREPGSSRKLFEKAGSYRIDVVAQHLDWALQIAPVPPSEAGRLKRHSEGRPTIEDSSQVFARQVSEDSFESWRPVDDRTLLLFAKDESRGFRIMFANACNGLTQVSALMFVSAGYGSGGELYDAILLDDGTHCPFERVVPTVFD